MAKKIVIALLSLAFILTTVVGCSDNKTPADDNTTSGGDVEVVETAGIPVDEIKVGVVHIGDPADGSGYSYTHDLGIQGMQKNLGLRDDQIVRQLNVNDSDNAAITTAVEDCIAQGCNLIFTTSYGFMDVTEAMAAEYPDVYFSHGTGYKSNDVNFNNYFGRIYQARYLAGIAAGLKTESNQLGYVSAYGTDLAETCSGINAFALGAQSVNPDAVVYVKSLNSWFDPAKETAFAEALINMGCDVIAQHCDTANPQVAAEKAGVFGCGYNSDMTAQAPNSHLTAPVWNWDVYYTAATQAVIDGTWEEFGNYYGGIPEGFVDISPLTENCAEGTQEKIDAVKELIVSGDWDVFSGFKLSFDENNEVVISASDLMDNEGNVIVAAGEGSVEDSVITGSMNFFVDGVELK